MQTQPIFVGSTPLRHKHDLVVHTFIKEQGEWYIDLPDYLLNGGNKADLALAEGTEAVLDFIARGKKKVTLEMDTKPFAGAGVLELTQICDAPKGGGYYRMFNRVGKLIKQTLWLCDVTLFIFGDIPERIYVRRIPCYLPAADAYYSN